MSPSGLARCCGPGIFKVVGVVSGGVVPIGAHTGWVRASPARCGGALHCSARPIGDERAGVVEPIEHIVFQEFITHAVV